jgi:hypothetical protein
MTSFASESHRPRDSGRNDTRSDSILLTLRLWLLALIFTTLRESGNHVPEQDAFENSNGSDYGTSND